MDLGARLEVVERLSRLRGEGALTDEEFAEAKAKVLSRPAEPTDEPREEGPASGRVDQSYGYQHRSAPKWLMGAALIALLAVAAIFMLKPQPEGTDKPSLAARSSDGQPMASEPATPQQGEADAALDVAANAVEMAGAAVEEASQEVSAESVSDGSAASDWRGKQGRCRLNVGGRRYIDGLCWVRLETDGSFQVMSLDEKYFAQLLRSDGDAIGHWNETPRSTHAHTTLGDMTRNGACWSNAQAEICAWAE